MHTMMHDGSITVDYDDTPAGVARWLNDHERATEEPVSVCDLRGIHDDVRWSPNHGEYFGLDLPRNRHVTIWADLGARVGRRWHVRMG